MPPQEEKEEQGENIEHISEGMAGAGEPQRTEKESPKEGEDSKATEKLGCMYEDLTDGQIRLLSLVPGDQPQLVGELTIHSLKDSPSYEAVSYVWGGNASATSPSIEIDGKPVEITRNLDAVLRVLRLTDQPRILWIDALCINQKDRSERAAQASIMGEIYRQAANVNIWLGSPTRDHGALNRWLQKFQREFTALAKQDEMPKLPFYCVGRPPPFFDEPIITMMGSDWFRRMWVVQECALAHRTSLHYGEWNCTWAAGVDTVRLLRRLKYASVSPMWNIIPQAGSSNLPPNRYRRRARYSASEWYGPLIGLLELSAANHAGHRPLPDLLDLLYDMRDKQSTNPRDKIYGLIRLGMARCSNPLKIDYSIEEKELWDQLLLHLQACPDHPPI